MIIEISEGNGIDAEIYVDKVIRVYVDSQGDVDAKILAGRNLAVGPVNTLQVAGLWVETGLGPDGLGIDFWIEDGL